MKPCSVHVKLCLLVKLHAWQELDVVVTLLENAPGAYPAINLASSRVAIARYVLQRIA
jgi:hypothetical protein